MTGIYFNGLTLEYILISFIWGLICTYSAWRASSRSSGSRVPRHRSSGRAVVMPS